MGKIAPDALPGMDIGKFINDPEERIWKGPFTFVQGADPQFGMSKPFSEILNAFHNVHTAKLKNTEPSWEAEIELTRETVRRINKMKPKPIFFVICGDMLDAFPFEKPFPFYQNNDREIRDLQYKDFVKVLQELDPEIKLVCTCGNHDIGDIPTKKTLEVYRNQFGLDYFSFWVGGVKFVVLNSQFFFSPKAIPDETIKHMAFIDKMADASAKFIVVLQHIPYFGESPEEETLFKNIPKETRLVFLEKLWNAGVRYIFCGHYHRNAGGKYKDMEQVVTSAIGAPFGDDPSGYRVVHVGEVKIIHEYVTLRDTTDCQEFNKKTRPVFHNELSSKDQG